MVLLVSSGGSRPPLLARVRAGAKRWEAAGSERLRKKEVSAGGGRFGSAFVCVTACRVRAAIAAFPDWAADAARLRHVAGMRGRTGQAGTRFPGGGTPARLACNVAGAAPTPLASSRLPMPRFLMGFEDWVVSATPPRRLRSV